MTLTLCKLWPYLVGGLIAWLFAGLLARRFKFVESPLEKIIEKRVEVDNPKHLILIKKLEKENAQLATMKGKASLQDAPNRDFGVGQKPQDDFDGGTS